MKRTSLTPYGFLRAAHFLHLFGAILAAAGVYSVSQTVQGAIITLGDFSGHETVETYDSVDISMGPAPLTSLNGVTYTSLAGGVLSVSAGHASRFDNIPDASGDPAVEDSVGGSDIAIDFSEPVNRVGLLLSAGAITKWTVSALDNNLVSLGAVEIMMPANSDAVFAGLAFTQNIARLQITELSDGGFGSISVFDDLRYEAVVPIPAAVWLFVSGLTGLLGFSRKRMLATARFSSNRYRCATPSILNAYQQPVCAAHAM